MNLNNANSDTLCARCAAFDMSDFLRGRWTAAEIRKPVAVLGSRDEILMNADCKFCQALESIADAEENYQRGFGRDHFVIYAIPSILRYSRRNENSNDPEIAGRVPAYAEKSKDSIW